MMISYQQVSTLEELGQILALQQENLPKNISKEESDKEGFVTVEHTLEQLKAMNDECGHIIAVENDVIVGYALCMHPKFGDTIEVLRPMFAEIGKIRGNRMDYMAMGQICVAKSHRGKGIFRNLYLTMKDKLPEGFDTIITEVDTKNIRSMNAHRAVGFKVLKEYTSGGQHWSLLVLSA